MVDMNLNIKVPAVEMLLKYAASGIGAVAGSILAPRWRARQAAAVRRIEAEAEGDSLKLIAKAQAEAQQFLVEPGNAGSGILEISPDGGITQRIEYQEKKRQANIAAVVRDAAADLDDKEVSDHEPDPDWTARYFDCVKDVSSEEMRKIWAKILAGEIENPNSTSMRTFDILKNMTKDDARLFELAFELIVDNFVFCPKEMEECRSLVERVNVMRLQDVGVLHGSINPVISLTREIRFSNSVYHISHRGCVLKISSCDDRTSIAIPALPLTQSGTELSKILKLDLNMFGLQLFSRYLCDHKCKLSFAQIIDKRPDGSVTHTMPFIPIEPDHQPPGAAVP